MMENGPTRAMGVPAEALAQVASHFAALAVPIRLRLLEQLRLGERPSGELARLCGTSAANASRHLAVLERHGLVARARSGTTIRYRLADESVAALCDGVCRSIARRLDAQERAARDFLRRTDDGGKEAP